jgi:hypothetical protein
MTNTINTGSGRKTVKVFCVIALLLVVAWFLVGRGLRLRKALSAADSYQARIAALGPLDPARVEELARLLDSAGKASSALNPGGLQGEDPAADSGSAGKAFTQTGIEAVRGLLRAAGIRGERLRFSGKEGAQAELALRCETVKFFEFLSELPGQGESPVNYLSIRAVPGSREADIVMRFNYE